MSKEKNQKDPKDQKSASKTADKSTIKRLEAEIATLKQEIEILRAQVRTDYLTGLNNKQHFLTALENEMERTRRSSQPTTILIIDADHFKSVNDTYGHIAGDKVLKNLSTIIRKSIRKIDIPCRYGGEEFCVILPSTTARIGFQVAERLRKMVENSSTQIDDTNSVSVSVSIGLATYAYNSGVSIEEFIADGDEELYKAKKWGRNQVSGKKHSDSRKSTVTAAEKSALFPR